MEFLITLSDHWSLMAIKRFLGNKDIVILLNNFVKWFKRKGSPVTIVSKNVLFLHSIGFLLKMQNVRLSSSKNYLLYELL